MQAIANTFVERGVENTYVLSGGMLGAAYRCTPTLTPTPTLTLTWGMLGAAYR